MNISLRNKIISLIISFIITAIVIHNTHGRISRNRYWKIEISMIAGFFIYWAFALFMLFVFHIPFFYGIGVLGSFVFIFKYWQLQTLRFHDLNLSGWYSLLSYVPLISLYFLYLKFAKKRTDFINEFDETIDYLSLLKKNGLYPQKNLITIDGLDFSINSVKFEYKKFHDHIQYEVSDLSLKDDKLLEEYCNKNLKQTENAPGYASQYRISFLDEGNLLERIKKELNGIVVNKGFVTINGAEIFVRKNYMLYEIVYDKKYSDKVKVFSNVEESDDYCCQSLNKSQLIELLS
ncbi:DUF805 domain-containing protein [Treponema sp.]|uniref:DUF805 domain-containing protein n=1 Tax=Treponema sp. TaxID=166 RepID=UPI00388FF8AB